MTRLTVELVPSTCWCRPRNGWTAADAEAYTEVVSEQWAARSRHDWTLDCTVLVVQGIRFDPTRT